MKFKAFLSRCRAHRIESHARRQRRALRDHQRGELERIHELEMRSRGLRLYAAWSLPGTPNIVHTRMSDWRPALQPAV